MVRPSNIRKMAEGSFINHGVTNDLTNVEKGPLWKKWRNVPHFTKHTGSLPCSYQPDNPKNITGIFLQS